MDEQPTPLETLTPKQIGCGCLIAGAGFLAVTLVPAVYVIFHFVHKHW